MMREFFVDKIVGIPFKLFGAIHISCMIVLLLGIILIFRKREEIYKLSKEKKNRIKMILISIMFLNMVIYYVSKALYGVYDWRLDLPFHLCFISGFLFMYAQLTNNKKLYGITLFLSFMGPLPAVLWPDLISGFDSFVFYQYFISHHFFILTSLFMYYANGYTIKKEDGIKAFVLANGIFVIMSIFNYAFNTNYIMSNSLPPQVVKLYPFVKNINYPAFWLEITGVGIVLLIYFLIRSFNIKKIKY